MEPERPSRLHWPQSRPLARLVALLRGLRNAGRALARRLTRRRRVPPGPYTVLVTGASVGVGLELTRLLLLTHHRLALTARASSLERFAAEGIVESDRVLFLPLDVTVPEEREAAVRAIEARWGGVDVLVNNAGVSYRAVAEHTPDVDMMIQLDANYLGPMALVRRVLPHMRSRHFGRIINVSSVGGMTAMPTMSAYSASKFALEGASESLWYEMRPWGVFVSLVRPGFINSDGFRKVRFTAQGAAALADPDDAYHHHYLNMGDLVGALMQLTFHSPADVAETIARLIEDTNPPLRVAGTWDAFAFDLLRRLLPARLYHRLLYAGLPRIWEWGGRPPS
ncbi:MAG: SDR family NAD(P)-dependent oxidoreductase [Pseudomonadota bacterium]|nr:SDR family NAD(P)-dependent oxidoreductase [Pseudomonadota bacterium]